MNDTSQVVGLIQGQPSVEEFAAWAEGFPAGTMVRSGSYGMEARTPGEVCGCHTCDQRDRARLADLTGEWTILLTARMVLCPTCGNKRCPKATYHDNPCSGSNEPGQDGSRYL